MNAPVSDAPVPSARCHHFQCGFQAVDGLQGLKETYSDDAQFKTTVTDWFW